MAQLRRSYDEFISRDTVVIVAGPEAASAFEDYWEENGLKFIGLPDPKHSVLKLYGQKINLFKLGRMPAQVLIDKEGVARMVHYGKSMKDIPPPNEVLEKIDELNQS